MERLTRKRADNGRYYLDGLNEVSNIYPKGYGRIQVGYAVDKLAKFEDLQEQGRLLELPCAVGDTVYITDGSSLTVREIHVQDNLIKYFVARFNPNGLDVRFTFDKIGKTVFLSREEAEKALKVKRNETD